MAAARLVAVVGPTAVGKTRIAIAIAKRFGGEIVSADSMQIYRGLDIGSAKPSAEERLEAVHHLLDFADPRRGFSAAEYQRLAREAVLDIAGRGRLPILAGGTGLYVSSVIYDLDFSAPPLGDDFREELAREAREGGAALLHDRLRLLDAEAAARIHPNNLKKIVRALEILHSQGGAGRLRPFSEAFRPWAGCEARIIGLDRERDELHGRIESRVDRLMEAGLADEVKRLAADGLSEENISMMGIGYKEILGALRGEYGMDRAVCLIKRNSRRYARRQLTWFRRYPGVRWFSLSGDGEAALEAILGHLSADAAR
ncbi:MAG: tRNA (adenosine(37)-N6)-dimethylallyltransferase MiaA [Clostridiales Family XIII bacterium]|jgi:tRNA dimethylallyltransferase|nr:tRNA (adenosine(37)-N6)-dimethylallyltransferase MiaA [Clostridiales Family XIII bacterium]